VASHLKSEAFLLHAHKRFPGVTSECFANLTGASQPSPTSYDHLLKIIPRMSEGKVLDLACGDGILCQRLEASRPKLTEIIGVDFSPHEIRLAERTAQSSRIRFFCGRAQQLNLAAKSFDYILCHMAFMLMENIEKVVSEIARVLKEDGHFSCVIPIASKGGCRAIYQRCFEHVARDYRLLSFETLGDRRARSSSGLKSLFEAHPAFHGTAVFEEFEISLEPDPQSLVRFFMGHYETSCLTDQGIELLRQRLTAEFVAERMNGTLSHGVGFLQMTVRKQRRIDALSAPNAVLA
jgi:ubiquinone/menaquinone biosynthesis C-methylase UbiE